MVRTSCPPHLAQSSPAVQGVGAAQLVSTPKCIGKYVVLCQTGCLTMWHHVSFFTNPVVPSVVSIILVHLIFPLTWWTHIACHGESLSNLAKYSVSHNLQCISLIILNNNHANFTLLQIRLMPIGAGLPSPTQSPATPNNRELINYNVDNENYASIKLQQDIYLKKQWYSEIQIHFP